MQYLAEGDATGELNPQAQHSLIVEALPRELRSDTALYEYFEKLFLGQMLAISAHRASASILFPFDCSISCS